MSDDARAALERLIRERGEDYASLSRLLGRNPSYMQQFIKRGSPRKLEEGDRRLLARYFGVAEEVLGGPEERAGQENGLVTVRQLDVGASAGSGTLDADERLRGRIAFDAKWLRSLTSGDVKQLSIIRVEGDSMFPTLASGDEILVDSSDAAERLRDGIYVLRMEEALVVKRLAVNPAGRRVSVKSDNDAYPSWPDCELRSIDIVGRVIWAGRKLA